uniref:Odorant receptor n=1 Tax=Anopheles dirus TaxID=7168 RepID=A0A182NRC6_9DIPT
MFRLQRKILLVFGVWPADRLVRRWYIKVLIGVNLATLAICMVAEFLYGFYAYRNGNLSDAIESVCPTVSRISGFFRMVFFLINEQKIERVLNNISHLIRNAHPRESEISKRMTTLGQQFTKFLFLNCFLTAVLFAVIPFGVMAYNWFQDESSFVKVLPFKMSLPFDSQNTVLFVLTTMVQNYASAPTITAIVGGDALFTAVCLYVCGQFQAIKLEIETLALTIEARAWKSSSSETDRINHALKRISTRHQQLIELVSELRSAFAPNILLIYACTALMMCMVSISVLILDGMYKLSYLSYTISLLALLFLYSYSGTMVRESYDNTCNIHQSEMIETAVYDFPWYQFDRNTRHLIQLMMVRAQHGCNVDVPFFKTSLASFSL